MRWSRYSLCRGHLFVFLNRPLLLRRRAPDGGYYHDPDRAAGAFGVLGASFAVLLAFGSIKPEAMHATLVQLEDLEHSRHPLAIPPCDNGGERATSRSRSSTSPRS
jgi:hypothetical protein